MFLFLCFLFRFISCDMSQPFIVQPCRPLCRCCTRFEAYIAEMNTKLVLLNSLSEHRASVIDAKRAEISRLRFLIRILQSGVELAVEEPMEHE